MPKQCLRFDGRLLKVYQQDWKLPNGHKVTLEIVRHPGAVLIAPFIDTEHIIMLRQYRPVIDKYIYELPAGTLAKGEQHLRCAHRELKEETGYVAKKMTRIGEIYPAPGYTTERIIIFKAEKLIKETWQPEQDEIITSRAMSRSQIKTLLKRGRIIDAKTICALALCGWA